MSLQWRNRENILYWVVIFSLQKWNDYSHKTSNFVVMTSEFFSTLQWHFTKNNETFISRHYDFHRSVFKNTNKLDIINGLIISYYFDF